MSPSNTTLAEPAEQKHELTAINHFALCLAKKISLDGVLRASYDYVFDIIKPDMAIIYLRNEQELIPQNKTPENLLYQSSRTLHIGQCLCGLAAQKGGFINSINIHQDSRCTITVCKKAGLNSISAIALKNGADVIGVLAVGSRSQRDFSKQSDLLATLANHIATAVVKSRLYTQIDAYSQHLEKSPEKTEPAKAEMQAIAGQWKITFDAVSDSICVLDADWQILQCNAATCKFLQLPEEKIIGRKCYELVHGTDQPIENCPVRRIPKTSKRETEILKIGNRHYNVTADPMIGCDGRFQGAVHIINDITERIQFENKLIESEERFREVAANINEVIWLIDWVKKQFIYVSPAYEKIWGRSIGNLYHRFEDWANCIHPEDIDHSWTAFTSVIGGGGAMTRQYRIFRPDGAIRWICDRSFPIFDKDNNVVRVTGVAEDITERKVAEEALRDSEDLYRQLFEAESDAIFLVDDETGKILEANKAALLLYGYSRQELLSKYWTDFSDEPESTHKVITTGMAKEDKVISVPVQIHQKKDGTTFPVEITGRFFIRKGHNVHINACRDITDRLRIQSELKESELKFRSMMEAMLDPVYICSTDFIIQYMNPAMIRRLGADSSGSTCYESIHRLKSQCPWCVKNKIMHGETHEQSIVSPLDNRTYQITDLPVYNSDASVSKMCICRDISDYREAVKKRIEVEKQLQQSRKIEAIGTLAGGIAHDFNNILSSVIGYTELALLDVPKNSAIERYLKNVYAAGNRAKELVKQILTFARTTEKQIKPIKVSNIATEALELISSTTPSNITIKKFLKSDAVIMGDPTQIHQIFMNLCTNAVYSMEDNGGILTVCIEDLPKDQVLESDNIKNNGKNFLKIVISDTGKGIAESIMDTIFEPYFTTKKTGEGSGLGLSVVHGIVKSYGGDITVSSKIGKGTDFTIIIPAMKISPHSKDTIEAEDLPTGRENILMVDDEQDIVEMANQFLRRLGYHVTVSTSSLDAYQLFLKNPDHFDLVITDMTMPGMTGDKLASELIKINPDIRIILCTGYSKRINEQRAQKIGIRSFAYKPLITTDLAKLVRKVLDSS
ncbi:MAG: PAS domain S-box protein [Desulfobacteraceae bacterium]|nr:PAS domain S-box protein [Desulfobacteraceae bacterium]